MTDITREQAEEAVEDLILAYSDYEITFPNRKTYREHYYAMREKIVTALLCGRIPGQ